MPRWSNVMHAQSPGEQRVDGAPPRAAAQAEARDEQNRRAVPGALPVETRAAAARRSDPVSTVTRPETSGHVDT